jgi:hypothetical protein
VHVTGAVLAILGGNVAILAGVPIMKSFGAQRLYRLGSIALAAVGLASFALVAIATATTSSPLLPAAVWERSSVYTIIAWQLLSGVCLFTGWAEAGAGRRPPAAAGEAGAP